jgi:hypothetical protein
VPPEPTSFEELLAALARADVRFLVIGGVACALCGFVRTTEDLDLLVRRSPGDLERMIRVLASFGEGYAAELTPADFPDEEGALRIVEDFPVDVFVRLRGLSYEDLVPLVRYHEARDTRIPFLGAAGLIRLKQDSLREKDRIDVAALRRLEAKN